MTEEASSNPGDPGARSGTEGIELQRRLNLPLMILYGLGTTVGGGIYVLVGEVAGRAGLFAPVSFLAAAALITLTALTFAEMSSRFPKSAGEAIYVEQGLGRPLLGAVVGIIVVTSGIVSSAALSRGFVGYLQVITPTPEITALLGTVLIVGLLAAWGIGQSVGIAAVVTVVEIAGLVFIVWVSRDVFQALPSQAMSLVPPLELGAWLGIVSGSFLAFYAFIGFEDMVNVAEEVKNVRRTMPIAIIVTLLLTTLLYLAVTTVAVLGVPMSQLANSEAPIALLYERYAGRSPVFIGVISMAAVLNGALIQIIMASRVIYGMATQGWLPSGLGRVTPRTRTPLRATALVTAGVMLLSISFAIDDLAQFTSLGILIIAVLVNSALIRLKLRGEAPSSGFSVPLWVPVMGMVVSAIFAALVILDFVSPFVEQ